MTLEKLFYPESVAVIGASKSPDKVGHRILKNLLEHGFQGEIIPVNPTATTVLDQVCFPSLAEYDRDIDLAIIAVPAEAVLETAKEAIRRRAGAIIVVSSGFRESGETGAKLEQELLSVCQAAGVRLLGPNCLGVINTDNSLDATFSHRLPLTGGISVITQSGALCVAMLDQAAARHLGLAKLISIGNKTDISEVDLFKYLAADPQTKVIVAYLEEISSGDYFVKAAEAASAQKPVIIMKSATTAAGRRAAASHTGMLLGSETAYGAAFKRAGVIRADTFHAMFDYAALFAMQPLGRCKKIVVVTNSGGGGAIAADAVEQAGLEVTRLHIGDTAVLGGNGSAPETNNPIDVPNDADPERYAATIRAAQQDEETDAIVVIIAPQTMSRPVETARAIGAALDNSKPAVVALLGTYDTAPGPAELAALNLPDYDAPERAVDAIRAMHEYWLWKNRPPRRVTRFRVNRRKVERIIRRHQQTGRLFLGEVRAKDILRAYGFNTPAGSLASANEEAVELAQRFGFPVAMKIVSPNIIHKTDLGGVKLNLASSAQVEDAYDLMMLRIKQKVPDAVIEGVFVEKMAAKGLEVIIGMHRDPQFGPMLMFGLGGIFVEVMKDVTFHLAPITESEAVQMLKATRSYEMLQGKRGSKGVDISAIANCMQRISQLTTDFPQIRELDINPLIVSEEHSNPVVVDARITLAPIKESREGKK